MLMLIVGVCVLRGFCGGFGSSLVVSSSNWLGWLHDMMVPDALLLLTMVICDSSTCYAHIIALMSASQLIMNSTQLTFNIIYAALYCIFTHILQAQYSGFSRFFLWKYLKMGPLILLSLKNVFSYASLVGIKMHFFLLVLYILWDGLCSIMWTWNSVTVTLYVLVRDMIPNE